MPVKISKLPTGKYSVRTPHGVKARHTTRQKALAQARLLRGIDHGWTPSGKVSDSVAFIRATLQEVAKLP